MLPSMDDNELNELFRRREACLRDGIPREVYVEAVERAHELRRTAFAAAFRRSCEPSAVEHTPILQETTA
jgi:hypothetical protein